MLLTVSAAGASRAAAASTRASAVATDLRLISYFPARAGWERMWERWDGAELAADLERVAGLGANAVRIVVSVPAFGFPAVDPVMRARLDRTLSLAAAAGLKVELTLFDDWTRYREVAASRQWAAELLAGHAGDPEIAYLDLQNELPAGDPRALAWAREMVPYLQSLAGGIPVTVSTSISSGVAPLRALAAGLGPAQPDLYDVHYYGGPATAHATLAAARRVVGAAPLVVGETGFATDSSYGWAAGLATEPASLDAYQDYYYRAVDYAARALSLAPPSPWILYDMPRQGDTRWGEHMGLLTAGGDRKPAARSVARIFAGQRVSRSFNNGFEQAADLPFIWRRWLPHAAAFSASRRVAHSGRGSVLIEDVGGDHRRGCPAFYAAPIAAVEPGRTYEASAWARGRRARGLSRVVLVWIDRAGRYLGSTPSAPLPPGRTRWTKLTAAGAPPSGASGVEIDLQVCENPGRTWFDDVDFASR